MEAISCRSTRNVFSAEVRCARGTVVARVRAVGELDSGQVKRPPVDAGNGERCFEEPRRLPVGLLEITPTQRRQRPGVTGIPLRYPDPVAWALIAPSNRRAARSATPRLPAAGPESSLR